MKCKVALETFKANNHVTNFHPCHHKLIKNDMQKPSKTTRIIMQIRKEQFTSAKLCFFLEINLVLKVPKTKQRSTPPTRRILIYQAITRPTGVNYRQLSVTLSKPSLPLIFLTPPCPWQWSTLWVKAGKNLLHLTHIAILGLY